MASPATQFEPLDIAGARVRRLRGRSRRAKRRDRDVLSHTSALAIMTGSWSNAPLTLSPTPGGVSEDWNAGQSGPGSRGAGDENAQCRPPAPVVADARHSAFGFLFAMIL